MDGAIPLCAGGIGAKSKAVGTVIKRVYKKNEIIILTKRKIPPERFNHVGPALAKVANSSDVNVMRIVGHPNGSFYFSKTGIHGQCHKKITRSIRLLPGRLIYFAINKYRGVGFMNMQLVSGINFLRRRLHANQPNKNR